MKRIAAQSPEAHKASSLLQSLQEYFTTQLNALSVEFGDNSTFEAIEWFRNSGKNGGGVRFVAQDEVFFNRASVNYSQVQYDNDSAKNLASATALSTIIHPNNPHLPSMHMHFSWTQMKDSKGYWRMMADLNPSIVDKEDALYFSQALKGVSAPYYEEGAKEGDRYFNIPTLERHRGVSHFYLENFFTSNPDEDFALASKIARVVIATYIEILRVKAEKNIAVTQEDKAIQLAYHTLYLFQVLTLDKGTTSGLLIHNENDTGIMGSIPSHVNVTLLQSWLPKMQTPQDSLLANIINVLGTNEIAEITPSIKVALANVVRKHYQTYPKALSMQASASVSVPTVANHQ